jgi:hypothetical protein
MLAVIALIGVVGIAIHVEKVLNRCKLFVEFAFFMAEREDEKRTLRKIDCAARGTDVAVQEEERSSKNDRVEI